MLNSTFTVLVCGGRDYQDAEKMEGFLDRIHAIRSIELLVTGACYRGGADLLAEKWARGAEVPYLGIPARFRTGKAGRGEGPLRNQRMLDLTNPHLAIAFPGGNGTKNLVKEARSRGVWTVETGWNPWMDAQRLRVVSN